MKRKLKKSKALLSGFLALAVMLCAFPFIPASAAEGPFEYLSDLEWVSAAQGWSGRTVQKDKNINGGDLKLGNETYEKGLGTHAASEIVYRLNGAYSRFTAVVGLDSAKVNDKNINSVQFQVYVDGDMRYESVRMGKGAAPDVLDVDVLGAQELRLVVLDDNGKNSSCWSDWADAKLYLPLYPETQLSEIQIDRTPLAGFDPQTLEYGFEVSAQDIESVPVPQVTATAARKDATVTVEQAESVPGTAVIVVQNGEKLSKYKVNFTVQGITFLSDLKWETALQGLSGKSVQKDKNIDGGVLRIGERFYRKGLGTCANSSISYQLGGAYTKFLCEAGVDASQAGEGQSLIFIIKCNGEERYRSEAVTSDSKPLAIELNVEGVEKLELIVLREGDDTGADWANWGFARLESGEATGTLLSGITVNGEAIEGFDANRKVYTYYVPVADAAIPTIAATPQEPTAAVAVTPAEGIPGKAVVTVTNNGNKTDYIVNIAVKEAKITLTSDNANLQEWFDWAVHKVDQYVMTGQVGVVNKSDSNKTGSGVAQYSPSYWAGYYDRTAYYSRDFCHQATGGQIAGLRDENMNMFKTFAKGATEARKWYTLWAFNFDGSNYTVDYSNDNSFVREVPAQFELVQRAYEQYLWTGDRTYIDDPTLWNFYTKVMTDFITLHDTNGNGVAEGTGGGIRAGSCTYNERGGQPIIEAGDAIGSQYQATLAYAGMLRAKGLVKEADEWDEKAVTLKKYFNEEWSVMPGNPDGLYARALSTDGVTRYNDFGKENSWFMPMKLITEPGARNDAYLDFIAQKLGSGIGSTSDSPKNIEAYTYIPDTYFPYNRNEEAWKWMSYIMSVKDKPHERPIQGTNGDYPELSFTFVSQTIEGVMGIEPNAGEHQVVTAAHLTKDMGYVDAKGIHMGNHLLDVRHDGLVKTTLKNNASEALTWEARFYGNYDTITVDGIAVDAQHKLINGVKVSYTVISVNPGAAVAAVAENPISIDKSELLKKLEEARNYQAEEYTEASFAVLTKAIEKAQGVADSDTATEQDCLVAIKALDDAIKGLKNKPAESNKRELNKVLIKAEAYQQSDFMPETWPAFDTALTFAQEIGESTTATQQQVDKARHDLVDAMLSLRRVPDRSYIDTLTP